MGGFMTGKSLIEQIEENANFVVPCPSCHPNSPGLADTPANQMGQGSNGWHKRGRFAGLPRNSMPLCRFCRGGGVVFLNRTCECGMPAVLFSGKQKVWYCGAEPCATSAAWRMNRTYGPVVPWEGA